MSHDFCEKPIIFHKGIQLGGDKSIFNLWREKYSLKLLAFLGTFELLGMFGWWDNLKIAKKYWYLPQILPI